MDFYRKESQVQLYPGCLDKKGGGGGLPCPLAHVLLYLTLIEV